MTVLSRFGLKKKVTLAYKKIFLAYDIDMLKSWYVDILKKNVIRI